MLKANQVLYYLKVCGLLFRMEFLSIKYSQDHARIHSFLLSNRWLLKLDDPYFTIKQAVLQCFVPKRNPDCLLWTINEAESLNWVDRPSIWQVVANLHVQDQLTGLHIQLLGLDMRTRSLIPYLLALIVVVTSSLKGLNLSLLGNRSKEIVYEGIVLYSILKLHFRHILAAWIRSLKFRHLNHVVVAHYYVRL